VALALDDEHADVLHCAAQDAGADQEYRRLCARALKKVEEAHAQVADDAADRGASAEKGFHFWFVGREDFLALAEERPMPRHQTLKQQGLLSRILLSEADVVSGAARRFGAVSHRWIKEWHTDPDAVKLRKIKEILRENPGVTHVWLDWACIPQRWRDDGTEGRTTFAEQREFTMTLANVLPYLYLGCTVFVLFDADYNRRFWPSVEAWTSMRRITAKGLEEASPEDLRAQVYGIGGSDGQARLREYLCDAWLHKSAEEAVHTLRFDEYFVTNLKDKEVNLQIVSGLDERVEGLLRRNPGLVGTARREGHGPLDACRCGADYPSAASRFCHMCGAARTPLVEEVAPGSPPLCAGCMRAP